MEPVEMLNNIYWVGAIDWNIRHFHGFSYSTHRGTTYNAYLIIDKKIALVDTVYKSFSEEMIERIKKVLDPAKISYIIANHVESDHSGSIKELLKLAPNATIVGTEKCKEGLEKHYFGDWKFQTVKTGDTLNLGERTLTFLEAPMLHWPDTMFTYIEKDSLLLSNDGFGQHLASSSRFDDEVDQIFTIKHIFQSYSDNFEIIGVNSGREYLNKLQKDELPDLILMDIMMPEMSGWEVFDKIKNTHKWNKIPIIFLSARIDPNSTNAGEYLGDDFISKPFNAADLIKRINQVLKIE